MIRGLTTTIACACLAGAVGVGLFFIKHEVKEQEARLAELNREIQDNQEAMHVLKAEWSYLNDPARLRALSEKHLAMKVMGPSQIASLDSLPAGGTAFAAARAAVPTTAAPVAVAKAAPAPAPVVAHAAAAPVVAHVAAAPAAAKQTHDKQTHDRPAPVAVAKAQPKPTAAPTKLAAAPAPAKPAVAATTRPALVPGADTTPRLAAAPAPAPLPAATAPSQRGPAQPARNIVIQSPALASTPALPGEVR